MRSRKRSLRTGTDIFSPSCTADSARHAGLCDAVGVVRVADPGHGATCSYVCGETRSQAIDAAPAGEAARATVGKAAYDLNVQQYCCAGLNFGYYYDDSPIIAYDGAAHPPYTMGDFTPATVPGCRVPHRWLADGRSLYDALGPEYTLLRAAAARGVPFQLLDLVADEATAPYAPYDAPLVLARPDQHVAWRGEAQPADSLALLDRVRGAGIAANV